MIPKLDLNFYYQLYGRSSTARFCMRTYELYMIDVKLLLSYHSPVSRLNAHATALSMYQISLEVQKHLAEQMVLKWCLEWCHYSSKSHSLLAVYISRSLSKLSCNFFFLFLFCHSLAQLCICLSCVSYLDVCACLYVRCVCVCACFVGGLWPLWV